jgi:hypothetical protein
MTKNKESESSIKTQLPPLDKKYLKISYVMAVWGITSLMVHGLILLHVPDLGHTTADPFTKFLNSIMGVLGFGGMFTLYMTVPFVVRTFRKDKGTFVIMIIVAVPTYWMFTGLFLMAGWQKLLEMF